MKFLICFVCMVSFLPFVEAQVTTTEQMNELVEKATDPTSVAAFAGFMLAQNPAALNKVVETQANKLGNSNGPCLNEINSYCPGANGNKAFTCLKDRTLSKKCRQQFQMVKTLVEAKEAAQNLTRPDQQKTQQKGSPAEGAR